MELDQRDKYSTINFEETELRLGLPGAGGGNDAGDAVKNSSKRGFSETVDLKLNLSSKESSSSAKNEVLEKMKEKTSLPRSTTTTDPAKPPAAKYVHSYAHNICSFKFHRLVFCLIFVFLVHGLALVFITLKSA